MKSTCLKVSRWIAAQIAADETSNTLKGIVYRVYAGFKSFMESKLVGIVVYSLLAINILALILTGQWWKIALIAASVLVGLVLIIATVWAWFFGEEFIKQRTYRCLVEHGTKEDNESLAKADVEFRLYREYMTTKAKEGAQ